MQHIQHNSVPYFCFESFPKGQRHAVLTRLGGVSPAPFASLNLSSSVPDDPAHLPVNRARGYGVLDRSEATLAHAHLVHAAEVAVVRREDEGRIRRRTDGLITDEPGCGLAMNYADCTPIFLYDPDKRAIGLGHAGWKGAVVDLPGAMVRAMAAAFGSEPERIYAGIGPCIGPCCYEVDEPLVSQVREAFAQPESLLLAQAGKTRPHFNLVEANRRNLARAGVQHIELSGLCTACRTDLFFSHRAEKGRTGRFGVMILLD